MKKLTYKLKEVSDDHILLDIVFYGETLGFVEIWNGLKCIHINIFENAGISLKNSRKIMRIAYKVYILNKLGLLRKKSKKDEIDPNREADNNYKALMYATKILGFRK